MRSRLIIVSGLALVALWGARCGPNASNEGGGSTVGPDAGAGSGGGADAGTGAGDGGQTSDAGAGGSGGGPDGGSADGGGGGGSPDAGAGDTGGGDADAGSGGGSGSPDAGSGGGSGSPDAGSGAGSGSPDAGSGGGSGSPDAGSGGGSGSAECDGVVPGDLGSSSSAAVPHRDGEVCWSATSDGNGYVVADAHNPNGPSHFFGWTIFAPNGAKSGGLVGDAAIAPQPNGFQSNYISFDDSPPNVAFSHWSETGDVVVRALIGSDACGPAGTLPVPGGGSVTVIICGNSLQGVAQALRFDAAGQVVAKDGFQTRASIGLTFPVPPATLSIAAGGDSNGDMLMVVHPGSAAGLGDDDYAARWFDPYGSPLTDIFSAAKGNGDALLRPLLSGEVALQVDGIWRATLSAGSAEPHGIPDWLASHPHNDFAIVRGGRAYALMPRIGAPNNDTLELVTPAGQSCGSKTFPVGGLSIGFDGTVISSSGDGGCSKTWWSGLLK